MTATAFAKCHKCSALLPDNGDDRREHLAEHADVAKKLEAQRTRVGNLLAEIGQLKDAITDFRRTLDQHPISAEPTEIIVNDIPDDEIDEYETDTTPDPEPAHASQYADEQVQNTITIPEYPPAIDRPDEPADGNTGSYNLYRA